MLTSIGPGQSEGIDHKIGLIIKKKVRCQLVVFEVLCSDVFTSIPMERTHAPHCNLEL